MAIGGWVANGPLISSAEILTTSCDFSLPEGRYGHITVTTADGKILVCGGKTPSGFTASCLQFNPDSKSWEHHSSMGNKFRHFSSAIALKHGVYILGGANDGSKRSSEFLATGSFVWIPGPNITGSGVWYSCGVKLSGTEFVILGGYYDRSQALVYSTTRNEWTEWPTISENIKVYGQSCVKFGDKILMAGGNNFNKRTVIFDTKTGSAREVTTLKHPRYDAAMDLFGGKPIILGGLGDSNEVRSDGEIWNMDTETWEEANISLNIGRAHFSLVATCDKIDCE